MFEKASKLKVRFESVVGNVTTEDLWDLPLTNASGANLDELAKSLNRALKEDIEESFVVKKTKANETLELKFSIVKHIIKYKLDEIEKREFAAERKAKKEKIMSIIADKEDDKLKNKSLASLKKMVDEI